MDDYGDVVYLDVQKTGSSFISSFLSSNLSLSRRRFVKHGRITGERNQDAFHFISVRNPFDQYLSLFQYGCEGRGGLFHRLKKAGHGALYEPRAPSFSQWLEFVLDEDNAGLLGEDYRKVDASLFGLQTFRFLVLSFQYPLQRIRGMASRGDVNRLYDRHRIHAFVLRNETLNEDLLALAQGRLRPWITDLEAARRHLLEAGRVNASASLGFGIDALAPEVRKQLRSREWFLFERFYS